jgi:hypothetical protein
MAHPLFVKIMVILCFAVLMATSLTIVVLSIIQTQDHTKTAQGTQLPSQGTDPCADGTIWGDHRPFRVIFSPDPEALYCGWTTYNTLLRIGLTLVSILVIVLSFIASIIKKNRVASWMCWILGIIAGFCCGIILVRDTIALSNSKKWCDGGLEGVTWPNGKPNNITCDYFFYILTLLIVVGSIICWGFATYASFVYIRRYMHFKPARLIDRVDDAEDAPSHMV